MSKIRSLFLILTGLVVFCLQMQAQEIPDPMYPPRLVNDYTGLFSAQEAAMLESKLRSYHDTTSTQIYVVVVPSLGGQDPAYYAYEVGEKWGIGQKGKDNGAVLLIKPRSGNERGQVFIATGYGLEGALPDAICKRIVEQTILPYFQQKQYYQGVDAGIDRMIGYLAGEYKADKTDGEGSGLPIWLLIIIIVILIIIFSSGNNEQDINGKGGSRSRSGPTVFFPPPRSGGGFGGFSGGGFGGGGGGRFGGGGAGGSW
ncbi:MAG: TPM domain-containing protein [Candidatus Azobacteroides sp.]|nr:TPM domain-containing protein [Candidatus Azobacteroides sp.]